MERFRTPEWRPYRASIFIGLGLSGIVPVIHGVTIYGYSGLEHRMSISWVIAHGGMYIFGAVLYAVRCVTMAPHSLTCLWFLGVDKKMTTANKTT